MANKKIKRLPLFILVGFIALSVAAIFGIRALTATLAKTEVRTSIVIPERKGIQDIYNAEIERIQKEKDSLLENPRPLRNELKLIVEGEIQKTQTDIIELQRQLTVEKNAEKKQSIIEEIQRLKLSIPGDIEGEVNTRFRLHLLDLDNQMANLQTSKTLFNDVEKLVENFQKALEKTQANLKTAMETGVTQQNVIEYNMSTTNLILQQMLEIAGSLPSEVFQKEPLPLSDNENIEPSRWRTVSSSLSSRIIEEINRFQATLTNELTALFEETFLDASGMPDDLSLEQMVKVLSLLQLEVKNYVGSMDRVDAFLSSLDVAEYRKYIPEADRGLIGPVIPQETTTATAIEEPDPVLPEAPTIVHLDRAVISTIKAMMELNVAKTNEIAGLNATLRQKSEEISSLEKELAEKNVEIAAQDSYIQEMIGKVENLSALLENRQNTIITYEQKVATLEEAINQLTDNLAGTIDNYDKLVAERNATIARQNSYINGMISQIKELLILVNTRQSMISGSGQITGSSEGSAVTSEGALPAFKESLNRILETYDDIVADRDANIRYLSRELSLAQSAIDSHASGYFDDDLNLVVIEPRITVLESMIKSYFIVRRGDASIVSIRIESIDSTSGERIGRFIKLEPGEIKPGDHIYPGEGL